MNLMRLNLTSKRKKTDLRILEMLEMSPLVRRERRRLGRPTLRPFAHLWEDLLAGLSSLKSSVAAIWARTCSTGTPLLWRIIAVSITLVIACSLIFLWLALTVTW